MLIYHASVNIIRKSLTKNCPQLPQPRRNPPPPPVNRAQNSLLITINVQLKAAEICSVTGVVNLITKI
jgi:hypothetical protein